MVAEVTTPPALGTTPYGLLTPFYANELDPGETSELTRRAMSGP